MIWKVLVNLSLLLFTASAAMWVRSYILGDRYVGWSRHDGADGAHLVATRFACGHGQVSLERINIHYGRGVVPNGYSIESISGLLQRETGWQRDESGFGVSLPAIFQSPGLRQGGSELWRLWFPHYLSHTNSYGTAVVWGGCAITLPFWILCAATAVLPGIKVKSALRKRVRDFRSRRWRGRGLCGSCGFDARFSPERCPECGAAARN